MTQTLPALDPTAPIDQETRDLVRWLVDRAQISDLLVEFARTLDVRDFAANVALYLPDGVFAIAGTPFRLVGHDELIRTASPVALGQYAGTWHGSSNHAVTVDGDTARTRSYLQGIHLMTDGTRADHADGGGWYDCTVRRTPEGWRFATVTVTEVWTAGLPLPHSAGPPPAPHAG